MTVSENIVFPFLFRSLPSADVEDKPVNTSASTRTSISLRPKRVVINPQDGHVDNILPARVKEIIYLGDHLRSRLKVCGRDDFIVKVPNGAQHQHLTPGESVKIGWKAEDCRALDTVA